MPLQNAWGNSLKTPLLAYIKLSGSICLQMITYQFCRHYLSAVIMMKRIGSGDQVGPGSTVASSRLTAALVTVLCL